MIRWRIARGYAPHHRMIGPSLPLRLARGVAWVFWTVGRHRTQYAVLPMDTLWPDGRVPRRYGQSQ